MLGSLALPHLTNSELKLDLKREYVKASLDPERYLKYLQYEVEHNVRDSFRRPVKSLTKLRERVLKGVTLLESINELQLHPKSSDSWNSFLLVVLSMRQERLQGQRWRQEYLDNKQEIELIRSPVKRLSQKKAKNERAKMERYSNIQQHKIVRKETERSVLEASMLTGRYLKQLQLQGLIPLPSKLDYTKENYLGNLLPFEMRSKSTENMPKSIAYKTIKEAYDLDYVDAIIKPALEYDINYHFYLKHLRLIVNEKGPYEVKIKELASAPVSFPYIKLPFVNTVESKRISLDVSRLIRFLRVLKVWKSAPNDEKVPENKYSDGSYGVKGCKGFYHTERMFPSGYYEQLAQWEGEWESLIENTITGVTQKQVQNYVEEWMEFISDTTASLEKEWKEMKNKHGNDDLLRKEQTKQQEQMLIHYDEMINKYNCIVDQIEQQQIWKHSELVNGNNLVNRPLVTYLQRDDNVPQGKRKGLPENGRLYLGKSLADVLADNDYHYFKMGQKFKRELNFKDIDKFIRIT